MTTNADKMIASFPSDMKIPDELIAFFRWQDAQGLYRHFDSDSNAHALIDPTQARSMLCTIPANIDHAKSWTGSEDPSVYNRLAPFFRLGGDGTYAALWRDDAGETQIVALGSGSGSTMMGVLTDNAVDFLRVIAIGYDELHTPYYHDWTPDEIFDEEYGDELDDYEEGDEDAPQPPVAPIALQQWVSETFTTTIPETASELWEEIANMDADSSDDPFWIWDHSMDKWK